MRKTPLFHSVLIVAFLFNYAGPQLAFAQASGDALPWMPKPGVMVHLSPAFAPAQLRGITIHPDNALQFDFLIQRGDQPLRSGQKNKEYKKLVKYFLASLTVPDQDQWVNLSPYEKKRIIAGDFGKTKMGRDLLTQDYLLKEITSSLIYPESKLGKEFWQKVYQRAWQEFHTTQVPVNTFNKVWIVPDQAVVYESGNSAYILKSHLKVMLEEDYLALKKHDTSANGFKGHTLASQVIREVIVPTLETEVNTGKNFALLRQIYSGMILATWYKKALKKSLLGQIYADQDKVKGVDQDPKTNEAIYQRYLKAFKKGVYNYIKEDEDKYTHEVIPRKYFSGGFTRNTSDSAMTIVNDRTVGAWIKTVGPATLAVARNGLDDAEVGFYSADKSMIGSKIFQPRAFNTSWQPQGVQVINPEQGTLADNPQQFILWSNSLEHLENAIKMISQKYAYQPSTGIESDLAGKHYRIRFIRTGPMIVGPTLHAFAVDYLNNFRHYPHIDDLRNRVFEALDNLEKRQRSPGEINKVLDFVKDITAKMQNKPGSKYVERKLAKAGLQALVSEANDLMNAAYRASDPEYFIDLVAQIYEAFQHQQVSDVIDFDEAFNISLPLPKSEKETSELGIMITDGSGHYGYYHIKRHFSGVYDFSAYDGFIKPNEEEGQDISLKRPFPIKVHFDAKGLIITNQGAEPLTIKVGKDMAMTIDLLTGFSPSQEDLSGYISMFNERYPSKTSDPNAALNLYIDLVTLFQYTGFYYVTNSKTQEQEFHHHEFDSDIAEALDWFWKTKLTGEAAALIGGAVIYYRYLDEQLNASMYEKNIDDLKEGLSQIAPHLQHQQLLQVRDFLNMKRALDSEQSAAEEGWTLRKIKLVNALLATYPPAEQRVNEDHMFEPSELDKPDIQVLKKILPRLDRDAVFNFDTLDPDRVTIHPSVLEDFRQSHDALTLLLKAVDEANKNGTSLRGWVKYNANNGHKTIFVTNIRRGLENPNFLILQVKTKAGEKEVPLHQKRFMSFTPDQAMLHGNTQESRFTKGGIDFNSANLDLHIKRNGRGVPLPLAQQDMAQLNKIQGFVPEIIEIKPVTGNLPILSQIQSALNANPSV